MKNFIKITYSFLFICAFSLCLTSCGGDTCYECTTDDGAGNTETTTFCEGEDDGSGGTITEEALEEAVTLIEAFGGTCEKQ